MPRKKPDAARCSSVDNTRNIGECRPARPRPPGSGKRLEKSPRKVPEMPIPRASRALERFTVLDLTRVRSGPTCVRQLADWGANVIKIEHAARTSKTGEPPGGPREGPDFQNLHRNKRSMTLNLKSPEGLAAFKRHGEEGRRRGRELPARREEAARHRLQGPRARSIRRSSSAAFPASARTGPMRSGPGFDQIAQGMGGLMSITGLPGQGPVRVGIPIADLCAGLFCALGIMVALLEREKSKKGQHVTTSLLQAQIFMLDFQAARWLVKGEVRAAGRQQSSDLDSDRRVQDLRRPHQHRLDRTEDLGALLQGARRARDARQSRLRERRRRARRTATRSTPRSTAHTVKRTSAGLDRALQRGGRAVRADLRDRPDVRRPAGRAPRHGAAGQEERQVEMKLVGQPMSLSRTPSKLVSGRPGSASRPTGCSRNSASRRPRSRRCARRRRSDAQSGTRGDRPWMT